MHVSKSISTIVPLIRNVSKEITFDSKIVFLASNRQVPPSTMTFLVSWINFLSYVRRMELVSLPLLLRR